MIIRRGRDGIDLIAVAFDIGFDQVLGDHCLGFCCRTVILFKTHAQQHRDHDGGEECADDKADQKPAQDRIAGKRIAIEFHQTLDPSGGRDPSDPIIISLSGCFRPVDFYPFRHFPQLLQPLQIIFIPQLWQRSLKTGVYRSFSGIGNPSGSRRSKVSGFP